MKTKQIIDGKKFRLVKDTVGVILDSIWISEDETELKIKIAWRDEYLSFRPLNNEEKSL